jgi:hypothetical protein
VLVGVLTLASASFLVSISKRNQVAQVKGRPIYLVTDVALIPLSSQSDADAAITQARNRLKQNFRPDDSDESDSDLFSEEELSQSAVDDEPESPKREIPSPPTQNSAADHARRTSIAEDVIGKQGKYGRFAERWFSRRGWSAQGRRMQGMSTENNPAQAQPKTGMASEAPAEKEPSQKEGQEVEPPIPSDLNEEPKAEEAMPAPSTPTSSGQEKDPAKQLSPVSEDIMSTSSGPDDVTAALAPKIVRITKLMFSSNNFYFSYDYDISHSLSNQPAPSAYLPLFKLFDPVFFWNRHLMKPLIDAGQDIFVLPLMQGFVGQRMFTMSVSSEQSESTVIDATESSEQAVQAQENLTSEDDATNEAKPASPTPSNPQEGSSESGTPKPAEKDSESEQREFLLTLISRRSTKRAGFRYLRRGVDEDGFVANFVESEQLLSAPTWDPSQNIYSFLQLRGSIPVFFSQSPYSLKPVPTIYGSHETNQAAFKKHFGLLTERYGSVQAANLVEKHGNEAKVGNVYEKSAAELNKNGGMDGRGTELQFEWFDFHQVCRGMRFENVSVLMDTLAESRAKQSWTIQRDSQTTRTQGGVLRTNCMDCLDRTNVVQAATALRVLEAQLGEEGIPQVDLHSADAKTAWFNNIWADNGDAISKQYAGTAALKGDYTRTKRRNIGGALTDFGLTLNRYYNNIVNDYFAQAVTDYLLGRATELVFTEFEADMRGQDYAVDLRKVRQSAIETCIKIVVDEPETEDLIGGWTLSCPSQGSTVRTLPFEECVLLLTDRSIYFCRFDWGTEKVKEFEKVPLRRVQSIQRGAYITSTLAKRDADVKKNVGFLMRYVEGGNEPGEGVVRVNTRSLDSSAQVQKEIQQSDKKNPKRKSINEKYLAFKALPPRSSYASVGDEEGAPMSEEDMVANICDEVKRATLAIRRKDAEELGDESKLTDFAIDEKPIISLADARKSTGYFEQLGYNLKRLVWA